MEKVFQNLSIDQQVAYKLAPIVHLHSREAYRPASVDWYLPRCILLKGSASISDSDLATIGKFLVPKSMSVLINNLTIDNLVAASSSTNYGGNDDSNFSIFPNVADINQSPIYKPDSPMSLFQQETLNGQPLVDNKCVSEAYVHIASQSHNSFLISYYFFYPYNGGMGPTTEWGAKPLGLQSGFLAHIADWETITAFVKIEGNNISLRGIIYEAHGNRILFNDAAHTFTNKTLDQIEPVQVYSCWHSHASRTAAGKYPTETDFASDYADDGPKWITSENLVFISNDQPAWIKYNGLWGANITVTSLISSFHADSQVSGPPGPAFHDSWNDGLSVITFGNSIEYDDGKDSSIVAINNNVVEVHKSASFDELWYHVGSIQENYTINFGTSIKYDNGVSPAIAVCTNGTEVKVVEVHKSASFNELWYHVGTVQSNNSIKFGNSIKYDDGVTPSVAICNNGTEIKVIEVHKSASFDELWYRVGTLQSNGTINFSNSVKYDNGVTPSVAAYNVGNEIKVIEVHKSASFDELWYHVGTLQPNGTINFGPSIQYDNGTNPSVAVYVNGTDIEVFETHKSESFNQLWYQIGTVQPGNVIKFGNSVNYDEGITPSITVCNNGTDTRVIESHKSASFNGLWYHVGMY